MEVVLAGVQERLGPLQAWLFPQRVYLELQDQTITAMVLNGRRLTFLDQLALPPGLCMSGRPVNGSALADLLADWLIERGYPGARIWAVLPGCASELRLINTSAPEQQRSFLPKELEALSLPWPPETVVDLLRAPLTSSSGGSVSVAVEAALLEDWIDLFADAGLALDALEAAPICALRCIEGPSENSWLLGLEPEQSWFLRLEKGAPIWQWRLPPLADLGSLQTELSQCLHYWEAKAPKPRSIAVVSSAAVPASALEALEAAIPLDLDRLHPWAKGQLENGLDDPTTLSLGLLWGLAAAELPR